MPYRCVVQNSNLVLTAETRTREATEPSGEPETLWNNMKGKMGDRVQYGRPEEEKKVKKRKEPVDDLTFAAPQTKRRVSTLPDVSFTRVVMSHIAEKSTPALADKGTCLEEASTNLQKQPSLAIWT